MLLLLGRSLLLGLVLLALLGGLAYGRGIAGRRHGLHTPRARQRLGVFKVCLGVLKLCTELRQALLQVFVQG